MSDQWSLYDTFTPHSGRDDRYGVTDLIHELIQSSAYDVCLMKRNALTTYKLLSRAGSLYDEIITLIKQVDSETEVDSPWDAFDKYTDAIPPLEDLLLKLDPLVASESKAWVPTETKVEDLIDSVDAWKNHRSELRKLFHDGGFYSSKFLKTLKEEPVNSASLFFHDDSTFLNALCKGIQVETPQGIDAGLFKSATEKANEILSKATSIISAESLEQTIRSTMLVNGVITVLAGGKENDQCKAHLASTELWNKAESLLSAVVDHLSDQGPVNFLEAKVNAFIKFLGKFAGAALPDIYFELKKDVRKVHRPYYALALALVKLARELMDSISKLEDAERTPEKVAPLRKAINGIQAAITDAASAVTSIRAFVDAGTEIQARQSFTSAETALKDCFSKYNVTWDDKPVAEAKAKDKVYVERMKKTLAGRSGQKSSTTSYMELEVVRVNNDNKETTHTYLLDGESPLSAILWKVVGSESTTQIDSCHFSLEKESKDKLSLGTTVKDITEKDGKRKVYLIT